MNLNQDSLNPTGHQSNIVEWIRTDLSGMNKPLIKRYPQIGEKISKIKGFAVKEHEKAILLKNGEFISEMESGTYELDKQTRKPGTEIIWIDTTMHDFPWGISQLNGIRTKDGFLIGLFGELKLHIIKPASFYKYVVGGSKNWNKGALKDWIKSLLHTSLRDIYQEYNLLDIFKECRESILNRITGKIIDEFYTYGIILDSFNVLGYKTPEEADKLINTEQTTTVLKTEINLKSGIHKVEEYDIIYNRIKSLKKRIADLQDQLLENAISKEEYKEKKNILTVFIHDSETELNQIQKNSESNKKNQKKER